MANQVSVHPGIVSMDVVLKINGAVHRASILLERERGNSPGLASSL